MHLSRLRARCSHLRVRSEDPFPHAVTRCSRVLSSTFTPSGKNEMSPLFLPKTRVCYVGPRCVSKVFLTGPSLALSVTVRGQSILYGLAKTLQTHASFPSRRAAACGCEGIWSTPQHKDTDPWGHAGNARKNDQKEVLSTWIWLHLLYGKICLCFQLYLFDLNACKAHCLSIVDGYK